MIQQHPQYSIPDNIDATLWRHLSVQKLEFFLQDRALYFCRSDKFSDTHEGSYSEPAIADRPRFFEGATAHYLETGLSEMHKVWGKCTYVNCWFVSDYESLAMWNLYGVVAIKSSIVRLKQSIQSDREFCLGPVNYIDYDRDMMSQANAFSPFFHKRMAYEHEREFRILTFLEENVKGAHEKQTLDEGLLIPVETEQLVDSVVISPNANKEEKNKIRELLEKYGMADKLVGSGIERIPRF